MILVGEKTAPRGKPVESGWTIRPEWLIVGSIPATNLFFYWRYA